MQITSSISGEVGVKETSIDKQREEKDIVL